MKSLSRFFQRTLLTLLIVLTFASSATAQDGPFEDEFEDPNLPGWQHTPNAYVEEGMLRLEPGAYASPEGAWGAFELEILARYSGQGDIAFMYNSDGTDGSILLYDGNRFELQRESSGQIEIVEGSIPFNIPSGEWFQLTLLIQPELQSLLINQEVIFSLPQTTPLSRGGFGLETQRELLLDIEHFILIPLGSEPMEDPEPVETSEPESEAETDISQPPSTRSPAYQVGSWTHLGGPIGGLGYDIRHSFENHEIWYVTDAWAGIHRSLDGGLTWDPINEGITATKGVDAVPIFSATVDPHDSDVIWIGTEGSGRIYRSSDGGDTWVEMSNGIDPNLRPLTFRGFTIDPRDQNTLFAMAEISSLAWTPDGQQRAGLELDLTMGIVYKTTDGGKNWVEVWRGNNLARYAWINPDNTNVIYVSTGIFDRESANTDVEAGFAGGVGILKSTDGGESWRELNQENGLLDLYVGSLYMHPSDPETLLAAAAQNNWSGYAEEHTAGVFLTHDGGETWDRVLQGKELFATVEYCEADPKIAYAASEQAVYRSDDSGQTWNRFNRPDNTWGPPGTIAGLPIDMQCDPDNTNRIFINNYGGGNFLSEDGGQTWVDASQGYSGALIRDIVIASGQPGWVYSSGRSGVFRSANGGENWVGLSNPGPEFPKIALNEITTLALNPNDPKGLLTAPSDLAKIMVSRDAGNSWSLATGMMGSPTSLVYAPSDPSTVYAAVTLLACVDDIQGGIMEEICSQGENFFYSSSDGGQSWTAVSEDGPPGDGIVEVVVHPEDPKMLFAGTLTRSVVKSTDGGRTWTDISSGLPHGDPVNTMVIDPGLPTTLYAGYLGRGLFKSENGGTSWRQMMSGLDPEANIKSIVVDPTNSDIVYLADHFSGVYVSTDGGESWSSLNDGLTHRTANVLALSDDGTVLYVGIEGAGVFRLGDPPPVEGAEDLLSTTQQPGPGISDEAPTEDGSVESQQGEPPSEDTDDQGGFKLPCLSGIGPGLILTSFWIVTRSRKRRSMKRSS